VNEREVIRQVLDTIKQREERDNNGEIVLEIFQSSDDGRLSIGDVYEALHQLETPLSRYGIALVFKRLQRENKIEFAGKQERRNISGGINHIPIYKLSER
jgi:hypothetical protein